MMTIKQPIQALLLDMDGVLWRDTEPIGNLPAIFDRINQLGWKTTFVTNNATRSIAQYEDKLRSFGVNASPKQIINSGLATAIYLEERNPGGGPVFIVGESGLFDTLEEYGFSQSENDPVAVVASLDRDLTYEKLRVASDFIRAGVPFLGTNPDPSLPTSGGYVPGTGALKKMGVNPEQALAVGDQMPTDIAAGIETGCQTALVLTGVSDESTANSFDYHPTYIVQDLSQLLEDLS
jgi:4-nitrophenyl phosphatase